MAIDSAAFGDPQAIRRHFSEYLEANLCGYLKLDFDKYFDGYELPKDSKFFTGNY